MTQTLVVQLCPYREEEEEEGGSCWVEEGAAVGGRWVGGWRRLRMVPCLF